MVNYSTATSPALLKGIHERSNSRGLEEEKIVLTDFNTNKIILDAILDQAFLINKKRPSTVRYVYNSNNSFFMYTDDGEFLTVSLRKTAEEITVKSSHAYEIWNGKKRVLSMHPTGVGLILETDDQVLLFADDEFYPIVNSEVLSVRTFIKSRRYKNVVAIAREDGVLITGLFQDHIEESEG